MWGLGQVVRFVSLYRLKCRVSVNPKPQGQGLRQGYGPGAACVELFLKNSIEACMAQDAGLTAPGLGFRLRCCQFRV